MNIPTFKIREFRLKSMELSWANECKVSWVEKKYHPFAFVIFEADVFELAAYVSFGFEFWGHLADAN